MKLDIRKGKVSGTVTITPTDPAGLPPKRLCVTCGGGVRRSHVTGIMHRHCTVCRYLRMIYGPNIRVSREES